LVDQTIDQFYQPIEIIVVNSLLFNLIKWSIKLVGKSNRSIDFEQKMTLLLFIFYSFIHLLCNTKFLDLTNSLSNRLVIFFFILELYKVIHTNPTFKFNLPLLNSIIRIKFYNSTLSTSFIFLTHRFILPSIITTYSSHNNSTIIFRLKNHNLNLMHL